VNNLIALKPKLSEKTFALSELTNTYTFEVPKSANKHDIAKAITGQYGVSVIGVRISSIPGKPKRSIRRGGRSVLKGNRNDIRKAYVTLAENDKLPIFAATDEGGSSAEEKK
jgi:large subunit ribosomal protein L23